MKLVINSCPWEKEKKFIKFKKKIEKFYHDYMPQEINKIVVDFGYNKKKRSKTYYGDFFNLYDKKSNSVYINLNMFYELKDINNMNRCLWSVIHELVHVKQIQTKELKIRPSGKSVLFKNKEFKKLGFRMKTFEKLYQTDSSKATEYHIKHIPWEKDPYMVSDKYTGYKTL